MRAVPSLTWLSTQTNVRATTSLRFPALAKTVQKQRADKLSDVGGVSSISFWPEYKAKSRAKQRETTTKQAMRDSHFEGLQTAFAVQ
jgi:hypothetical protein